MIARLIVAAGLAALALVGLTRADGEVAAGEVGQALQCAQWTAPVDMAGTTFVLGPFPTKAAAEAAAANLTNVMDAIGQTYWPFFTCPGCGPGVTGCDRTLHFIKPPGGPFAIRQGVGGWYADFTATRGTVAAGCDSCP
jgi:hypothetical protein